MKLKYFPNRRNHVISFCTLYKCKNGILKIFQIRYTGWAISAWLEDCVFITAHI